MAKLTKSPEPLTQDARSKEEIFWSIFDSVVRLDIQKGHLAWTISQLARTSNISRPLIYYYFGKSKEDILQNSVKFLGEQYFGLSEERLQLWKEGKVLDSILQSRHLSLRSPHAIYFYLNRRHLQTPVGEHLREYERKHREKLQKFYPLSDRDQINALSAVMFGLVMTPDLTDEAVKSALVVIQENLYFAKPTQS